MKQALIDLGAIAGNAELMSLSAGTAGLLATVTGDGLGHGAAEVAATVTRHGVSWLAVTGAAEAMALHGAGTAVPVLLSRHAPAGELATLIRAGIELSVPSTVHLYDIAAVAGRIGIRADVHLMAGEWASRNGTTLADWPLLVAAAREHQRRGSVRIRGLLPPAAASARVVTGAPLRHVTGSPFDPAARWSAADLVHAGTAIYGADAVGGLRAAMTVSATVVCVRASDAGRRAVLCAGAADGVPVPAADQAGVLLHAGRCRIVAVEADRTIVDAGHLPVEVGDRAVLMGPGGQGEPTVLDWAAWSGLDPATVLTGFGTRLPRRHVTGTVGSSISRR